MEKIMNSKITKYLFLFLIISFIYFANTYRFGFSFLFTLLYVISLIISLIFIIKDGLFDKILDKVIDYRFIISIVIFIILVLCKVHGSSIGAYNQYLGYDNNNDVLFGTSRDIRSDEWMVMTPYYFSQQTNNYRVNSNQMSIDGQNMIIGYNSPVKDFTILGKPLVWGFLLFGNDYGLSWYWCLKLILIILVSYEVTFILTKKKKISVLGSLLIAFGPSMQWWFAPHMPDVILWSLTLLCLSYHLLVNKNENIKNITTVLLPFVFMEFVIALFPSFQVGLGYFILVMLIGLLLRERQKLFENKKQIIRICIVALFSGLFVLLFLKGSLSALKIELNTVYPGHRVELGGQYLMKDIFTDLSTPFLSYVTNKTVYANSCEDSTFIHFGVFILLLSPIIFSIIKDKRERFLGYAFIGIIGVNIIFMLFGFPSILAKISFYSFINRMKMILGLIFVFFTIWGFSILEDNKIKNKEYYYLSVIVYCVLLFTFIDGNLINYLPKYIYIIEILLYALILMLFFYKKLYYAYSLLIGILLFSSISINPIVIGTGAITNHEISNKINEIVKKDKDAYWIGYENLALPSFILANGGKTFNAVNFYPDFGKWNYLDKHGKYDDVYNRYAHIVTAINPNKTSIMPHDTVDSIRIELSFDDMKYFNIKYILSIIDISNIKNEKYYLEELSYIDNVHIYELKEVVQTKYKKTK